MQFSDLIVDDLRLKIGVRKNCVRTRLLVDWVGANTINLNINRSNLRSIRAATVCVCYFVDFPSKDKWKEFHATTAH